MTMLRAISRCAAVVTIAVASATAFGVDPPDARVNPVSSLIETVDAAWYGNNYNVRYTATTIDGAQTTSYFLTTHTANDVDPRIAIAANGDTAVVWWRDLAADTVLYRKQSFTTGLWSAERLAGTAGQSNSHPRVNYANGKFWVAFQIQNPKNRSVAAQVIDDTPEPITAIVATTTFSGDLDIRLHAESGHLWLTWIDSNSYVGYSEYIYGSQYWAIPAREPFSAGGVLAALARVRSRILGL
jgi:hypothetical protein